MKRVPEEFLKSRDVRWTRMKRGVVPWGRLKKDSGWLRLKKEDNKWMRMTRSPRIIDKFGRIL